MKAKGKINTIKICILFFIENSNYVILNNIVNKLQSVFVSSSGLKKRIFSYIFKISFSFRYIHSNFKLSFLMTTVMFSVLISHFYMTQGNIVILILILLSQKKRHDVIILCIFLIKRLAKKNRQLYILWPVFTALIVRTRVEFLCILICLDYSDCIDNNFSNTSLSETHFFKVRFF